MDITQIVRGIVEIVVGIAAVFIIPWLKAKVGEAKLAKIIDTIDIFVAAAEQVAARDGYDHEWKKQHVIEMLEKNGYTVDDTIDDYIEAAVLELHNQLVNEG